MAGQLKKKLGKCWQKFLWLDKFLDHHFWVIFILLLIVLIRLPYFFEPHYYMDEGIYLTIGQGIDKGLPLYRSLFDHKTPLIYWLAALVSGNFFKWRMVGFGVAVVEALLFYKISRRLLRGKIAAIITTLIFVLMTNLPIFEGNVLNGELLMMLFVLGGLYILLPVAQTAVQKLRTRAKLQILLSGVFFGLAFLTKFHAVFDMSAVLLLLFLTWQKNISWQKILYFIGGVTLVSLLVALYFLIRGDLGYYLYDAFIYNFGYSVNNGSHAFLWLVGVVALVYVIYLIWQIKLLQLRKRPFNVTLLFVLAWLIATFIGANLSGRAYAHYFLQIWPALSLAIGLPIDNFLTTRASKKSLARITPGVSVIIFVAVSLAMIGFYTGLPYYKNFWQYARGRQSFFDYLQIYGDTTQDNYQIASFLKSKVASQPLLIFGNNPMLYSLTDSLPAILPFTTNFHYYDFVQRAPDFYPITRTPIFANLTEQTQINYVVMMKNLDEHTQEIIDEVALKSQLQTDFAPLFDGETLTLWQRN